MFFCLFRDRWQWLMMDNKFTVNARSVAVLILHGNADYLDRLPERNFANDLKLTGLLMEINGIRRTTQPTIIHLVIFF